MSRRIAGIVLALAVLPAAGADEPPRRVRPGWGRRAEAATPAPSADPSPVPQTLRRAVPPEPGAAPAPRPDRPDPATVAAEAAVAVADALVRTNGRQAYYRVGFWEGLRRALVDPGLGAWDRREGERDGRRDPFAFDHGEELGTLEAERRADARAVEDVARAFHDLTREPDRLARGAQPPYAPPGPWAESPRLDDVWADCTLERVLGSRGEWRDAFDRWDWTPRRLAAADRPESFHDAAWDDPDRAYEWERRHGGGEWTHPRMTPEESARFREVFRFRFAERIAFHEKGVLARAWDRGWRDGWRTGAFVVSEMAYRDGYAAGFDRAVEEAAVRAYVATWPDVYATAYGREYLRWSRRSRIEIVDIAVVDGNDDGIQEPGEPLEVEVRLANFGGMEGSVLLRLTGRGIESPAEATRVLGRRSELDRPATLSATVRPDAEAGSAATLRITAGEDGREMTVPIAWPLAFTRDVAVARDTLAGRASIEVEVVNRARRPVRARVAVEGGAARSLGELRGGERGKARFEIEELRPLDILAGRASVRFTAGRGETLHDTLDYRFHRVAVDLGADDLLDYLVARAKDGGGPPADLREARALLVERLRADWEAAVDGSGNPYRDDLRSGGTTTALGALVRAAGTFVDARAFAGLRDEVTALADELPGAHPNLRRSFRKLADRLP